MVDMPICTEFNDGTRHWTKCVSGHLHRPDGPAVEHPNGSSEWWLNGERHRTDGPAVERPGAGRGIWGFPPAEWWLRGARLDFEVWLRRSDLPEQEKLMLLLKYG